MQRPWERVSVLISHSRSRPRGGRRAGYLQATLPPSTPPGPSAAPSCVLRCFVHFAVAACLGIRTVTSLCAAEEALPREEKPVPGLRSGWRWGSSGAAPCRASRAQLHLRVEGQGPGQEAGGPGSFFCFQLHPSWSSDWGG